MKTLHLVLKHKWYDKIASGKKTSEYRECKPYWNKRLIGRENILVHSSFIPTSMQFVKASESDCQLATGQQNAPIPMQFDLLASHDWEIMED